MMENTQPATGAPSAGLPGHPVVAPSTGEKTAAPRPKALRSIRPQALLVQWVIIPLVIAGALVALGAHLGANGPDQWYTRGVVWVVSRF